MPEKFRCAAYMDMYNQVDKTLRNVNKSSGLCSECGKYGKVSTVYRNCGQ